MGQRRGSPSNREGTTPKFGVSQVRAGVDRFSFSFPVDWAEGDEGAWERISTVHPGLPSEQTTRSAREGPFFVSVQSLPPEAPYPAMGKVEYNPSRVVDPEGWELVPVDEALLTVGRARTAVETRLRPVWDPPGRTDRTDALRNEARRPDRRPDGPLMIGPYRFRT